MSLVLPICFVALLVGLFAPKVTARTYWALAAFVVLVIVYFYVKNAPQS